MEAKLYVDGPDPSLRIGAYASVPRLLQGLNMTDDPLDEAVEALRATGRNVQPTGDDLGLWLVDGATLTDGDLMALALQIGLMSGSEALQ